MLFELWSRRSWKAESNLETSNNSQTLGGGGGTSLSDLTGMCASFGWFLARKFWEWDVLFKERFWDRDLIFARNSGNTHVWDDPVFLLFFNASTGQKPHPYFGGGSQNAAKNRDWVMTEIHGEHTPVIVKSPHHSQTTKKSSVLEN